MSDTIEPLLFDLVAWVAKEPHKYLDVMEAWRTSCPRLPVSASSPRRSDRRRFML
jgi:hypothetical protein